MKLKHPEKQFIEISKLCSSTWKSLDSESKVEFQNLAKCDKQRFLEEQVLEVTTMDGKNKKYFSFFKKAITYARTNEYIRLSALDKRDLVDMLVSKQFGTFL